MVAAETLVLAQAGLVVTEAAIQKIRTPEAIVAARVEAALAPIAAILDEHDAIWDPAPDTSEWALMSKVRAAGSWGWPCRTISGKMLDMCSIWC